MLYIDLSTVSSVLAERCLSIVGDKDGRSLCDADKARLDEIARIAGALALPDASGFETLSKAAQSGDVRDLRRCALMVLSEPRFA